MEERKGILEILKNEYGITSDKELNQAIANLGFLDISVFCSDISSENGKKQRKRRTSYETVKGTV